VLTGTIFGNGFHGLGGGDLMSGGAGRDAFYYSAATDSGLTADTRDLLTDFVRGQDVIDLRSVDASVLQPGNNNFTWRGEGAFSTSAIGEVRYQRVDEAGTANDLTIIWADIDNDIDAEFAIALSGLHALTTADILL
jgi:hypothetical protein